MSSPRVPWSWPAVALLSTLMAALFLSLFAFVSAEADAFGDDTDDRMVQPVVHIQQPGSSSAGPGGDLHGNASRLNASLIEALRPRLEEFYVEMALCGLLILYVFLYQWGKNKNEKIAKQWIKTHLDLFARHFAHVGNDKGHILVKDGPADFVFYASGRVHCQYLRARLQMISRHDPVALLWGLFYPQRDRIMIEVFMNEKEYDPFVFGIVERTKINTSKTGRYDVSQFTRQSRSPGLPDHLYVFTESGDITTTLLDEAIVETLSGPVAERLFEELYVTDQPAKRPEKLDIDQAHTMYFSFKLPEISRMHTVVELHELALYMIDHIPEVAHFRSDTKNKIRKAREDADKAVLKVSVADREEALQRKRQEQRRVEQERFEKMTPDQQRKWEEKEHKRLLKRRQNRLIRRR